MMFMAMGLGFVAALWLAGAVAADQADLRKFSALILGYFLASYWMSPDLDHIEHRPGKHSFPLKPLIKLMRGAAEDGGRRTKWMLSIPLAVTEAIHGVLNTFWRVLWQPFASMVTHRGIIHWPVVGTLLKWYYLGLVLRLLLAVLMLWPASRPYVGPLARDILALLPLSPGGFLWDSGSLFGSFFGSFGRGVFSSDVASFAIGLLTSDMLHIAVDAWDSRGRNFVPPPGIAPRGLLAKMAASVVTFLKF
jgi:uncharacterized metal-binding protein